VLTSLKQLQEALSPHLRRRLWLLLALMVIGALLESLSVGAMVPVLSTVADGDSVSRSGASLALPEMLGANTNQSMAIWAMVGLVMLYLAKAAFAAWLAHVESGFAYTTQVEVSNRLYGAYLRQPWTFHLNRRSSELIRNATVEPQLFALYVLSLLQFCTELLVAAGLVVLLFAVEPIGALVATAVLGSVAAAFQVGTRPHIHRWGVQRQGLEAKRLQQLQHGLGGAKQVKLRGCERHFELLFEQQSLGYAQVMQRQQFVSQLPRLCLETAAVSTIALLVIALALGERPLAAALPTVAMFVAAAFRLLPSVNRIVGAVQLMRFRAPSLQLVLGELALESSAPPPMPAPPTERISVQEIRLEHVSFSYSGAPGRVLRDVSLVIEAGSTVGVVGPSGAGKSTVVDLMLGLLAPTSGSVSVNGVDVDRQLRPWQSSVGYVPQSIYLVDDSVRRNVAFGVADPDIDDDRVWQALRDARLDDFVKSLPQGLDTVTGEDGLRISGGQRQRLGIARALYPDPEVIVLDEATSALDAKTESEVMQSVKALRGRKTVIIIAHRLGTVEGCDAIYRVFDQSIERVKPGETSAQSDGRERLHG
jgi:ABC-type multidrug transport system fused ATPase/permease subunit